MFSEKAWMPHVSVAIACAFVLTACTNVQPAAEIEGSLVVVGSSSQQGAIGQWESVWRKEHNTVSVNFSPDGEQVGKTALFSRLSHVAATDNPIAGDDLVSSSSACGQDGAFSVPTAIFPVSVVYNLAGMKDVRLDGTTLAQMFNGRISTWDDPRIIALNPGLKLPSTRVRVVTARESSAATGTATAYLRDSDSHEWPSMPATNWPGDIPGTVKDKNSDVAEEVDNNLGAIAFLDTASVGTRFSTAILKFGSSFVKLTEDEYDKAAKESKYSVGKQGVVLSFSTVDNTGYRLATVGYQVFCYQYTNDRIAGLVRSWGNSVLGNAGQDISSRLGGVASPNEETRSASLKFIQIITSVPGDNK